MQSEDSDEVPASPPVGGQPETSQIGRVDSQPTGAHAYAVPFRDLGVDEVICTALDAAGIYATFPIQALTLPLAIDGQDIIGQARTGTGKTLAFGIPLLHRLARGPGGYGGAGSPPMRGGVQGGRPPRVNRARAVRLEPLAEITPVAIVAPAPVSTWVARGLLPPDVPHGDAARNAGRAALLVAALTARPEALFDATEDLLHQDYRASAMPATRDLVGRLRAAGLPAVVSGAGPSVLAFLVSGHGLDRLDSIVGETGIEWRISPLDVERQGASAGPGVRVPGDAGPSSPGRLNPLTATWMAAKECRGRCRC